MQLYNVFYRSRFHIEDGFTKINSKPLSREKAEELQEYLQEKNNNRVYFLRPHRASRGLVYERVSVC